MKTIKSVGLNWTCWMSVILLWGVGFPGGAGGGQPGHHTVKKEAFRDVVELEGVFEARRMKEIRVDPEVFTTLEVVEAAEHGQKVEEGDALVKLDLSKLREQIEEMEADRLSARLAMESAEDELRNLERSTPLKMEAAKRSMERANEDYDYFVETDRAEKELAATFNLKGSEQRLESAREELQQLEQMYKADDLTEETEEIVLKRQRYAVESAEYFHERTKRGNKRLLETSIPREHESLKAAKMEQDLAYDLAEKSLPRALEQKRLAIAKMRRDDQKNQEKLEDLKKDRRRLNVRAPMTGIVYYGGCVDGKWATGAAMAKKLVPGGKLAPKEVFMTVVDPDDLLVRVVVPEDKVGQLTEGQTGEASPVVLGDRVLAAQLESLSLVPLPGAVGFSATATVQSDDEVRLLPGMNCKLKFPGTKTSQALCVPESAVFQEDGDRCVYLVKDDDEPERRVVKVGRAEDGRLEILEGLSEGDQVRLEEP